MSYTVTWDKRERLEAKLARLWELLQLVGDKVTKSALRTACDQFDHVARANPKRLNGTPLPDEPGLLETSIGPVFFLYRISEPDCEVHVQNFWLDPTSN